MAQYEVQMLEEEKKQFTLDEPVSTTIMRDLSNIVIKLRYDLTHPQVQKEFIYRYAMLPSLREAGKNELRKWDLWGPLLLCLLLSFTLSVRRGASSQAVITNLISIMWVGSFVVFLNANFLGSTMSFFQSASLLGYCLFPLNVVSFAMMVIGDWTPAIVKLVLVVVSFLWATLCSTAFVGDMIPEKKRKLALYPIALFYLFLSWFVLIV